MASPIRGVMVLTARDEVPEHNWVFVDSSDGDTATQCSETTQSAGDGAEMGEGRFHVLVELWETVRRYKLTDGKEALIGGVGEMPCTKKQYLRVPASVKWTLENKVDTGSYKIFGRRVDNAIELFYGVAGKRGMKMLFDTMCKAGRDVSWHQYAVPMPNEIRVPWTTKCIEGLEQQIRRWETANNRKFTWGYVASAHDEHDKNRVLPGMLCHVALILVNEEQFAEFQKNEGDGTLTVTDTGTGITERMAVFGEIQSGSVRFLTGDDDLKLFFDSIGRTQNNDVLFIDMVEQHKKKYQKARKERRKLLRQGGLDGPGVPGAAEKDVDQPASGTSEGAEQSLHQDSQKGAQEQVGELGQRDAKNDVQDRVENTVEGHVTDGDQEHVQQAAQESAHQDAREGAHQVALKSVFQDDHEAGKKDNGNGAAKGLKEDALKDVEEAATNFIDENVQNSVKDNHKVAQEDVHERVEEDAHNTAEENSGTATHDEIKEQDGQKTEAEERAQRKKDKEKEKKKAYQARKREKQRLGKEMAKEPAGSHGISSLVGSQDQPNDAENWAVVGVVKLTGNLMLTTDDGQGKMLPWVMWKGQPRKLRKPEPSEPEKSLVLFT